MTGRRALLRGAAAGALVSALPSSRAADPPSRATDHAPRRPFAFALIGDLPYSVAEEANAAAILAATDADQLELVIHVGDIKGGRESCADALLARRRDLFARSAHPLVLLPGDNEWTDCHRLGAGGFEPRERLAALRALMWSQPGPLGGAGRDAVGTMRFERQPDYPENVRWRIGAVRFVAAHVVGSDNGRPGFTGDRAEFVARRDANRAWLSQTLALAQRERADALVIAWHADPDFGDRPSAGFADWIAVLQEVAGAFPNPILLLHGDSHRFRADRPLLDRDGRTLRHVTRVECFGSPWVSSWVRISYRPDDPDRFLVATRELRGPTS